MNTWIRTLITTWLLLAGTLASITLSTTVSANSSSDTYTLYYLTDMLGSPTVVTDGNGNTLWYEHNEPFGITRQRRTADNSPFPADYTGDRQGYTGHLNDSGSGLVYMQARYYDPVIGRFYSNDPVGFTESKPGYFNRYAYVGNNPFNFVDPNGEQGLSLSLDTTFEENWTDISKEPEVSDPFDFSEKATFGFAFAAAIISLLNPQLVENYELPYHSESSTSEEEIDPKEDYPADPDEWNPPEGITEEEAARINTDGKHRQWKDKDGRIVRRWDREGDPLRQPDLGPHWWDISRPKDHILPTR